MKQPEKNYYSESLHAEKLQLCYELAPPRVRQFLRREIEYVLSEIRRKDIVLDLGCGYGRVSKVLAQKANKVVGIDISRENIRKAKSYTASYTNCEFLIMNAGDMLFPDRYFDTVICIQNGISAFGLEPLLLMREAIRVTKKGGKVLFSSYAEEFWNDRLKWFQIQAEHGLIGEIDYHKTSDGVIICKDGFKAVTFSGEDFIKLSINLPVKSSIHKVDRSSIFCKMTVI